MNFKINDLVYNPKTKETGVVIKQCLKSVMFVGTVYEYMQSCD